MKTEDLIRKIVAEGAAKPLLHPFIQSSLWILGIGLYMFIFLFFDGFRPDLDLMLESREFVLELCLLTMIGISASYTAFCLSRPDAYQLPWVKFLPFPLIIGWAVIAFSTSGFVLGMQGLRDSMIPGRFDCAIHIGLFSLVPAIVIFLLVKMGATIRYYWAGMMSTLSVTAFAYLFMRVVENNDNTAHLLVWHALPIFIMCVTGMYAGRKALRW